MRKFGPNGTKWLKILHIILVVFFLGGILSSLALFIKLSPTNFDEVYSTYQSMVIISDDIVKYGGIGTILVGVIYGVFTNWGFFKYKWITVKWIIFIVQNFVGILVVDKLTMTNMALLESERAAALSNPVFLHNHDLRPYVVIVQIILTLLAIILSVLKPWKTKATALEDKQL